MWKSCWHFFFWHQGCYALSILTSGVNSELLVLSQSAETSKRKCQEKNTSVVDKQLLVPPSWQCANSCIATDLWLFGQHKHTCASSATLLPTPLTWLWQTFSYFLNWNPLWKDDDFRLFKRLRKIRGRSYARSRKGTLGLFPEVAAALGVVHQCRRGALWRW
jgi:hypothetical protein